MSSIEAYGCEVCQFELWLPVADLSVSSLGLYNDDRFPGRCILVLREHHTDLDELSPDLAAAFMGDMRFAGKALRSCLGVPRINYAILGNVEPHVHAHLIPRGTDADPIPQRPPWCHPDPSRRMEPEVVDELIEAIRSAVRSEDGPSQDRRA